jgi:hypothetical protein
MEQDSNPHFRSLRPASYIGLSILLAEGRNVERTHQDAHVLGVAAGVLERLIRAVPPPN